MKTWGRLASVVLLSLAAAAQTNQAAPVPSFNFTSFDYPSAVATSPLAINKTGTIVGYYLDASLVEHGFARLANGTFKQVDYPGAVGTILHDINDSNQVVGFYMSTDASFHGFLFTAPKIFTPIDYPGAQSTSPYGINNAGQIVGAWTNSFSIQQSFSLLNGTYQDLTDPTALVVYANSVNSAGTIAGDWVSACTPMCQYHGFILPSAASSNYIDVEYPGAQMTYVYRINDSNQVVGAYLGSDNSIHGWGGSPGKNQYFTIDYPGSTVASVNGINKRGILVGWYADSSGATHGFFAVPQ